MVPISASVFFLRPLASLGRWGQWGGRQVQAVLRLGGAVLRNLPHAEPAAIWQQARDLGNRSMFFVVVVMAFVGAIMVVQASMQAQRIVGDLSIIGPGFMQLLVREFAPTIVALMIAARYGAGVAAALGAMQVTEQVDALRLCSAEPISYLVVPRVLGGLTSMPAIVVVGGAVAFVSGGLAGHFGFGIGWTSYFRTGFVVPSDVAIGFCKAAAFGVAVPLVSSWAGLSARGGARGVGQATTRAVIGSSVAVLFLDLVFGAAGYVAQRW